MMIASSRLIRLIPSLTPGHIRVVHGCYDDGFPLAGFAVDVVRTSLRYVFNIGPDNKSLVNGLEVERDHRLANGDVLEFVRPWGRKGGGINDQDDYFIRSPDTNLKLNEILLRLRRIESQLVESNKLQAPPKDYYSVNDFAELVDLSRYSVREHCRLGRLTAEKVPFGRGETQEWRIPHAELVRYRNYGLLPLRKN